MSRWRRVRLLRNQLLYSVKDAAQAMSVSVPTLNRLLYRGEIASMKVSNRRCVPVSALQDYIEAQLRKARLSA